MKVFNTTRLAFQHSPVSLNRWRSVNDGYDDTLAHIEAFGRDQLEPAEKALKAVRDKWPEESELKPGSIAELQIRKAHELYDPVRAEYDTLVHQANTAADEILATPAPSVAALAVKLELLLEQPYKGSHDLEYAMRQILADARRLSGDA